MTTRQHYTTLGINSDATQDEIKKAYRERAKATHPDINEGNDEEFKAVNRANEILSDPEARKKYDESGYEGSSNQEQLVNSLITMLSMEFLDHLDVKTESLTEFLKSRIEDNISAATKLINSQKTSLEKAKLAVERVKRVSGGENMIKKVWLHKISETERAIEHHEQSILILKIALTEVDGYNYLVDKAEPSNNRISPWEKAHMDALFNMHRRYPWS